ncbi:MAG: preprotein translocase subunit SecG [Anaerolineales bacterium]
MTTYLDLALIVISIALIAVILLQSREAGLGGLGGGADLGGAGYHVRRGIEKVLFNVTIVLAALFFIIALVSVTLSS